MNKRMIIIGLLMIGFIILAVLAYNIYFHRQNTDKIISKREPVPTVIIPITLNPTQMVEVNQQIKNDENMTTVMDAYRKKTPLLYLMPVTNDDFKIDYIGEYKYRITLTGKNRSLAKQNALQWWKDHKIDPSTLEIVWK